MKKIQDNLHYFEISKNHQEKLLDDFYVFDEKHPDLNKYIKNTKEIKNILITIRTLRSKKEKPTVVDKYFLELSKIIGKYSNCSEFACFVNACDNIIGEAKKEINLLKKITERYFAKRILNEMSPEEWVQAILDTNSSRKKGKCGENKLVHILEKQGFKEVFDWDNFFKTNYCVVKFSKKFNLKNVRKNLDVKIKTKKQNKRLDLIIKVKNKILLCEAKHLNTSGGGQDKQISELIEILGLTEKNNVSFISFLDGKYSNILLGDNGYGDKVTTQRKEIKKFLNSNPNNYWVNTVGFENLILDLK
ncbi:MAG: DpnII family type II restriction endonuclease [Patescibacteria group bacterium]|nr:DpnII family type II restriction endonuclease [Patescibacteria group bacterium]